METWYNPASLKELAPMVIALFAMITSCVTAYFTYKATTKSKEAVDIANVAKQRADTSILVGKSAATLIKSSTVIKEATDLLNSVKERDEDNGH